MSPLLRGRLALDGTEADGWVAIDGAVVAAAGHGPAPRGADEVVGGLLSPGLVDLQVNGAAGHEVTGDDEALDEIERVLLAHGVTAWLPTVISADDDAAARAVDRLSRRACDPASTVAGIHLEGPFLAPARRGMHRAEALRAPGDGIPAYYGDPAVRLVTLAPELPGAIALIERLAGAGVAVSLGHSDGDAVVARRAVDAGATMVTHLLNAMRPLDRRDPGLAGVALTDERLTVGLIADGAHVDPVLLEVVRRCAGDRVALVSDASPAAAAPRPVGSFAGVALDAEGRADGRPAGSLRLLDEDVGTWSRATAASRAEALRAASEVPAAVIGAPPPLRPGSPADLVVWNDGGRPVRTMRGGRWTDA